ncbi:hypothetical protein E2N92_05415 [Methanofollis formosanus]|uniref:ATP-binding protein n=1 Tax=Methanofollis formosanus TaxID=299308 RepID=A0A8G1EGH0_9EURY|nr:ATP-binding protein [Methanofollis formosanus]QYZ78902.1 hypothetical protein E2N92_05415 [Methanofollis formosanus]
MVDGDYFTMTILGRTIEHLGTQMYKHRAPAIAELVANCWDAEANSVWITIPEADQYNAVGSVITIIDDGEGMDADAVQGRYLVVGRNRRAEDGGEKNGRKVMGRKGIGKLAGFGLAEKVTVTTWTGVMEKAIQFSMALNQLRIDAGQAREIKFDRYEVDKQEGWPTSGTRIELSDLRHKTPIEISTLKETLARRFSRTTRGEMTILINEEPLVEPNIDTMYVFPENGEYETKKLSDGNIVQYRYRFANKPLRSKELQGFVIYANERTAQVPPFFFNVESTASAQHSTRYVTGEIIADFTDSGTDNDSDVISTDRQELDWEKEELKELHMWGEELVRKVLRECAEMRGGLLENWIMNEPEFTERLSLLDPSTRKEISKFLKVLGEKSEEQDGRTKDLANSLIRAYEFRAFHDVIDDIEQVGQDPEKLEELLGRLYDWKVLESRAILEIIKGRLSIITKLERMIVGNSPETASSRTDDNLHDLLAEYPWIFNPEWQVYVEEKSIGNTLREWGKTDCPEDMESKRVDFLAFDKNSDDLIIIELKRPGHAVEFNEIQRLEQYQVELMKAREPCRRVLVYGGNVNIPQSKWEEMKSADDFEALEWSKMFKRARTFYTHYEGVLSGDVTSGEFQSKKVEIARTRAILDRGSAHRSKEDRIRGLGSSDV